ncbi:hypothetical protein [Brachyspira aalborgi]|nr:hypothetical protein [Brachyspira aalborgi]
MIIILWNYPILYELFKILMTLFIILVSIVDSKFASYERLKYSQILL